MANSFQQNLPIYISKKKNGLKKLLVVLNFYKFYKGILCQSYK